MKLWRKDSHTDFERKLEVYSRALGRRDFLIPIYRTLRLRPLVFWHPLKLFLFYTAFGHLFLALFFATVGLVLKFSIERFHLYADFFLLWQLVLIAAPMALAATLATVIVRRHRKLGTWEDL